MKTPLMSLMLCCLLSLSVTAQKNSPGKNYFKGKWQLTAFLHKTLTTDDMAKTYEFLEDSVIRMKSNRYQLTGKYAFDEKTATLTIIMQENKIPFRIIFLSPDKMQWHAEAAVNDTDDGIIERVPE